MPLPGINSFAVGDVCMQAVMQDIGTLGALGTVRFVAPMRGYVKWVGICPANPMTVGPTTFSLIINANSITAVRIGASIPSTIAERGYYLQEVSRMEPTNFFERSGNIRVVSGGETTATSPALIAVVLGAL